MLAAVLSVIWIIIALIVAVSVHCAVDDSRHTLWPRGLRWLPPAWDRLEDRAELTFKGADPFLFTPRRIRHLEELDDSFRLNARLYGVWPEWTGKDDTHGYWRAYGREIATCSCGYVNECALWCGDGHATGQCPAEHKGALPWPG